MSFVFRVFHVHGVSKNFFHFDQSDHSHFCNKSEEFSSALSFLGLPHWSQEGEQIARIEPWWCSQEGLWHKEHLDLCEQSCCHRSHGAVGLGLQEGRSLGCCGALQCPGRGGGEHRHKEGRHWQVQTRFSGGCHCTAAGQGQHSALISTKAPL